MGLILQAKMNATLNATDFWTEFEKLTREEQEKKSGVTQLTGASTSLSNAINHPNNIQEELLGKTIENIYRNESGGNYAAVINDSNNKASIGPYQANDANAVKLLKSLQGAQGLPSDLRNVYSKYIDIIGNGKALTNEQKSELSAALGNSEYKDIITKVIDNEAMRYQHDRQFKPYYAGYYDDGIIKDLRTLPMLADIGNAGEGFIVNKGKSNAYDVIILKPKLLNGAIGLISIFLFGYKKTNTIFYDYFNLQEFELEVEKSQDWCLDGEKINAKNIKVLAHKEDIKLYKKVG
jgi:hypothetical protein